jgi:hypothetical protein
MAGNIINDKLLERVQNANLPQLNKIKNYKKLRVIA